MSIFLSELGQIVFYTILVVSFLIAGTIALTLRKHNPPLKDMSKSKISNQRTWGLNVPVGLFVILLFGYTQIGGPLPDWSYYLGLILSILGVAVTSWAYTTLGQYFSDQVVIYHGHQLVERGPYRFVRHPAYSGIFLAVVGFGLAVQSWASVVSVIILYAILLGYRIAVEEKVPLCSPR